MSEHCWNHGPGFESTHWSLVLQAGHLSSPDGQQALATLCLRYWYPLYAYVRRRGHPVQEAEDLTQEFFARLLERGTIAAADPQRGRFRTFLLACLRNFLANEAERSRTRKRGGGTVPISLDFSAGKLRYGLEPTEHLSPERLFEMQWATTLLDYVMTRLRDEYVAGGKGEQFTKLQGFLAGGPTDSSYETVARELAMSPGAVTVAAHRLRRRFAELLREEIAHTVSDPEEVEDEIRSLFHVFGRE